LGVFAVTSAYTIFGAVALIVLRSTKSDEPYYVNLNLSGLAVSVGVAGGMVAVAVVFSIVLGVGAVGQSLVPTSFVQSASSLSGISLSALTC